MKDILCRTAATPQELRAAYKIRHEIFVEEQKLFSRSDRDNLDSRAVHLVALVQDEVVGTVRVYERDKGIWYGGRLAVRKPYRGRVGGLLVEKAVQMVKEQKAKRFLAYVQLSAVSFFKRRRWKPVGKPVEYHGKLHQLMEAEL